ncbi:hypothetical protein EDD84_02830 [Burkholderia gladioli]|nr:hypothetical protein [Burkholderia gladioli]AYQ86466.1 hypothetical protein EDD84_02830 [Burkholderia gladioli]
MAGTQRQQENAAEPRRKASTPVVKSAAESDTVEMEARAREVIRGLTPGLDGLSVAELLAEINRTMDAVADGTMSSGPVIRRHGLIRRAMESVGVQPWTAQPEQELDVSVYGIVLEPKRLLKACPELKPLKAILDGLTL